MPMPKSIRILFSTSCTTIYKANLKCREARQTLKMGFIVNPIAGMGGRVGLKGTDNVLERAIQMGAKPVAPFRAIEFLRKLKTLKLEPTIIMITCPGTMGEDEARTATFPATTLKMLPKSKTIAEDTKLAVKQMIKEKVDLIVFVGGAFGGSRSRQSIQ